MNIDQNVIASLVGDRQRSLHRDAARARSTVTIGRRRSARSSRTAALAAAVSAPVSRLSGRRSEGAVAVSC